MPTEQLNNNITTFKLNTKPDFMILLDDVKMLKGVKFFTDYVWDIHGIHVTTVKQWFQFSRRWYILHSPKKNIEHGMIEKCSVLTFFFHCDFITILNKCIFQWLFFQYGKYCFCGNEIKKFTQSRVRWRVQKILSWKLRWMVWWKLEDVHFYE